MTYLQNIYQFMQKDFGLQCVIGVLILSLYIGQVHFKLKVCFDLKDDFNRYRRLYIIVPFE